MVLFSELGGFLYTVSNATEFVGSYTLALLSGLTRDKLLGIWCLQALIALKKLTKLI